MNLEPWHGGIRKTLVVLGAGASYSAFLAQSQTGPRPPLDATFFSELQKLPLNEDVRQLIRFVRREFGSEIGLSMEEFFSQAEYTDQFHKELKIDRGPRIKLYSDALERFYRCLPVLFKYSIGSGTAACHYHSRLADRLHVDDVVISFNYDCIMDAALKESAYKRWDPGKGSYSFPVLRGDEYWKKHGGTGQTPKSTIFLLKPHGSMNWSISPSGDVSLVQEPYEIASAEGRIIPPTWFKNLSQRPFSEVWKAARHQIRACRALIVIGYSVPQTDLFSRALFKAEAGSKEKREKLDYLILVNPDPAARKRFLNLVRGGIEDDTKIIEYENLVELSDVLT